MAILFSRPIFAQYLFAGPTYYTDPGLDVLIGSAQKYCLQLNASQVALPGSTSILMYLERSNARGGWTSGDPIIEIDDTLADGTYFAYDLGTHDLSRLARLRMWVSQNVHVEIWLTGRDDR